MEKKGNADDADWADEKKIKKWKGGKIINGKKGERG